MDRTQQFRLENAKLKAKVSELEEHILSIVGLIKIFPSGIEGKQEALNDKIQEVMNSATAGLRIVTPKIGSFYLKLVSQIAAKGTPTLIIINDRRNIPPEYQQYYDALKNKANISIVNNPTVNYLLIMGDDAVIYSGGSLVKQELSTATLIGTEVKEKNKMMKIQQIINNMLPSFMR